MKKLILLTLMSAYAMSGFTNEAEIKAIEKAKENDRLCKIFTKKADTYESTMRNDSLAKATLVSYKKRESAFCNASAVKTIAAVEVENKKVAAVKPEQKIVETSKENNRLCKIFTKKVDTYQSTMRSDDLAKATLSSYKKRKSAFCNTSSLRS